METKTVERNWGLDLLRILAAFTVVMLHVSPQAYLDVEIASAPWNVMNVITGLCCWNVSAFFMLSGAFLLAPQKAMSTRTLYRKNIARLAAAFVFWSAVYALTYCLLRGKGKWTFLNELLRGHYHMWFVFTLISLYAVVPLLRKITESKKATEYFLLIGFLFTYLIGRALNFALLFELPHKDVLQSLQSAYAQLNPYRGLTALYAFVLGHYLMAYPLPKAAPPALRGGLPFLPDDDLADALALRRASGHQLRLHLRRVAGCADDDGGALRLLQGAAPDPRREGATRAAARFQMHVRRLSGSCPRAGAA